MPFMYLCTVFSLAPVSFYKAVSFNEHFVVTVTSQDLISFPSSAMKVFLAVV